MNARVKLLCPLLVSPLDSSVNLRRLLLASNVKLLSPVWRTEINVEPLAVGLFRIVEQVGFAKTIQPFCQLIFPAAAQVGVPPVNAFAVFIDVQMVTQLFLVMASVRAREMSFAKSEVILPTWLRTCISRKFGTPIAKMIAKMATVTMSSISVTPSMCRSSFRLSEACMALRGL